ncbi:hypothetical protein MAR_024850 [Mya arenaria]|uniref:Uncharacterized protein n=1 Tax=Mya arenaria TaxID=6604 RepID=A0ABY7DRZ8_MYAAR|nr:uncharacterized protein LOC128226970 isoform X2 [Mya arenaria]XP_052793693.1 uncharacterized protein LOC128227325 isoform X2 [Mya arenaria]WAR00468.1 hypothetical protein MAR_024840 [Mya arenaria]WAR00478.1 hypothetical protein MAR_024850 [Mya arenaria]
MAGTQPSYIETPWDRELITYDEIMADRENVVRLHKYNDFWDSLVKDVNTIVLKAEGKADADTEEACDKEKNVNQRAGWNENLEVASWKKRIQNEAEYIKSEIRMAAKASLAVRRVALKQQYERELAQWEKELALQGKTFYKQRI